MKVSRKGWISVVNARTLGQENACKPSEASKEVTPRMNRGFCQAKENSCERGGVEKGKYRIK